MLELLIIVKLTTHLTNVAKAKGRSGYWAVLGVVFWILGQLLGAVLGLLISVVVGLHAGSLQGFSVTDVDKLPVAHVAGIYGFSIAGMGIGAGLAYAIVRLLPVGTPDALDNRIDAGVTRWKENATRPRLAWVWILIALVFFALVYFGDVLERALGG
jgi:hypothetical protein